MVIIKRFHRNSNVFKLFLISLFLLIAVTIKAQVYPVQINGSMIGPNSLNLSDYSSLKSQDLMFFITLSDPVEATRLVKLKFSIVNNGQEIITTNPNYNPMPITLEKDITIMIDGDDLAGYLNEINLVGLGNQQAGGLIPEGFNGFCLEVIDIERNVVISDKFCSYGYFEFSDPPILNTPICDEQIAWSESQNIMFNWLPQHVSSSNPPNSVEYEFKLVELIPDQSPNDAFQSSTPLYETTTFSTTLFYLEDGPTLETGKVYAWNVRAIDSQGLNLFNNNGYSQICSFSIMEDEVNDDGSGSQGNCQNGLCEWTGDLSFSPLVSVLSPGDEIEVGFFTMEITDIQNSNGFYSGTGTIYLPFLFSKLKVNFNNLQINKDRRVYAGEVMSETPENESLIPELFSIQNTSSYIDAGINIETSFTDQTALALDQYFSNPSANLVSVLSNIPEESAIPITVPIGMDLSSENNPVSFTIAVTGVKFTANKAILNAVMSTRLDNDSPWIKFGIKDFCVQPQGLAQSGVSKLNLLSDFDLDFNGMPITFLGSTLASEGTYISWNCDGFEEFFIDGQYTFDNNKYTNLSNFNDPLIASFTTSTKQLDDIIVEINAIDDFSIVGADDFVFSIGKTNIDLSTARNIPEIQFPQEASYENTNESWTGFFVETLNLKIPNELQFGDNNNASIQGINILIDQHGLSGTVATNDFLTANTSSFGNWKFSIDNFDVNFFKNEFTNANINGIVGLPLINDDILYEGRLNYVPAIDQEEAFYTASLNPTNDITVGMAFGDPNNQNVALNISNTSNIVATYKNGKFNPRAEICGGMTINIGKNDFPQELLGAITKIEKNLPDGNTFAFSADIEMCLGVDPSLHLYGDQMFSLLNYSGTVSIPGLDPFNIDDALSLLQMNLDYPNGFGSLDFPSIPTMAIPGFPNFNLGDFPNIDLPGLPTIVLPDFPNLALPNIPNFSPLPSNFIPLGFNFHLPALPGISLDLGCWAIATPELGEIPDFDFALLNLKVNIPEFSCSPTNPTAFVLPQNGETTINVPFLDESLSVLDQGDGTFFTNDPMFTAVPLTLKKFVEMVPDELKDLIQLPEGFDLIVEGITFTDGLDAALKLSMNFDGLLFSGFLPIHPKGFSFDGAKIALGSDAVLSGFNMPGEIKILKGIENSFVSFNCEGIKGFNLSGEYIFPSNFVPIDNTQEIDAVIASLKLNATEWGDFIAETSINTPFTVAGVTDFEFEINNAFFDLSKINNIEGITFPATTEYAGTDETWTGILVNNLSLTLPKELSFTDDDSNAIIIGNNILIDQLGTSGSVAMKNFVSSSSNVFGNWAFTIDSLNVKFAQNEFDSALINGTIKLPLLRDSILYEGGLTFNNQNNQYSASLSPSNDITVGISFGPLPSNESEDYLVSFTVKNTTQINATYDNVAKKFNPSATLCGGIIIDIKNTDFPLEYQEYISTIEATLKEPFNFKAGCEVCLGIDPSLTKYGGKMFDLNFISGNVDLPNFPNLAFNLELIEIDLELPEIDLPELPNLPNFPNLPSFPSFRPLGLDFNIPDFGLPFTIDFWSIGDISVDVPKFSFETFTIKVPIPDFSCAAPENPTAFKLSTSSSTNSIHIPFLSKNFEVFSQNGFFKTSNDDAFFTNLSLKELIEKIPSEVLPSDLNLESFDDFDFAITGLSFSSDSNNNLTNGYIEMELTLGSVIIIGSLPIHPNGIQFDGFKIGPANDIDLGN